MGTLHCALENGADLYDTIALDLLKKEEELEEEERRMPNRNFLLCAART